MWIPIAVLFLSCSASGQSESNAELEKKCTAGDGASCSTLALLYQDGKSVPADRKKAHEYFRLACQQGHWPSCNNLTVEYKDPLGEVESRKRFKKLCDGGDAQSCYWLGARYISGLGGLPEKPK